MGEGGAGANAGDRLTPARRLRASLPPGFRDALRDVARRTPLVALLTTSPADGDHPERIAVLRRVLPPDGPVLEVGCGPRKTAVEWTGVDLVPGGRNGTTGNARGRPSQADVAAKGQRLPFRDGAFGAVVARHNLEHYVDLVEVLDEWRRVVRPGGALVVVVPDEDTYSGRTVSLDPTHFHAFTPASLARLLDLVGWEVTDSEPCVDNWSFVLSARRR